MIRLVSAIRDFAKEFLYTEEAREYTSGNVRASPSYTIFKVYVTAP